MRFDVSKEGKHIAQIVQANYNPMETKNPKSLLMK